MSPNIEERIKNYIEVANVTVNLEYLQQNNLGDILLMI